MSQEEYQQIRYDMDDVEVILEFPAESKEQDARRIKKEIKKLLSVELQEKIRRIF